MDKSSRKIASLPPDFSRRALSLVLALSVYFVGVTEFMLSSMLGPLAVAFDTPVQSATWLISSYACSYAIAAPVIGYFSDRMNRGQLLLVALLLFAIDSAGVIFAPTFHIAVGLRVVGGMASAALIPVAFALISDVVDREHQPAAIGTVMLGMTFGIAAGPAMAGVLTDRFDWRAPFAVTSIGCLMVFLIAMQIIPRRKSIKTIGRAPSFQWISKPDVLRPLIAKGAWNGTGVAAFLLSGQVLHQRYGFSVAAIGITVTALGIGLGIGNLLAGPLCRMCKREENALVAVTGLLLSSITLFMLFPLPLPASMLSLIAWGMALGAGAPLSTVVLAARAPADKGMVLSVAETLNNVAILCVVPLAMAQLEAHGPRIAFAVIAVGLCLGLALTLIDCARSRRVAVSG